MNALTPDSAPELFASVILGTAGFATPGVVTITGHDSVESWDDQQAKGETGASCVLNGKPLRKCQLSFYLAGDSDDADGSNDFTRWEEAEAMFEATTSGPTPIALPIYHPDLAERGWTEIVKDTIGGRQWDDRGGCTVQVVVKEYRPPAPKPAAKATVKPGAGSSPGAPEKPDPNAAAKQELAGLYDEAAAP